jgi:hypothetical protein
LGQDGEDDGMVGMLTGVGERGSGDPRIPERSRIIPEKRGEGNRKQAPGRDISIVKRVSVPNAKGKKHTGPTEVGSGSRRASF